MRKEGNGKVFRKTRISFLLILDGLKEETGLNGRKFLFCFGFVLAIFAPAAAQQPAKGSPDCVQDRVFLRSERSRPHTAQPMSPQPQGTEVESDVIRVETDLVAVDFDVRDKRGTPVKNLTAGDFRLDEDGVRQSIDVFAFGRESSFQRRIILIIDHSQSQIPYLATSIDAAKVLVDLLEPNDELAIVTDDVELVSDFSSDRGHLKDQLERLRSKALDGQFGRSKQLTALLAALRQLFSENDRRPFVILQTDGDESAEFTFRRSVSVKSGCRMETDSLAEIETEIARTRATVFSIIPGTSLDGSTKKQRLERSAFELKEIHRSAAKVRNIPYEENRTGFTRKYLNNWVAGRIRNSSAIERISSISGGSTHYLESPEAATAVYSRILEQMNERYLIGYYPTNTRSDGKLRKIKLSLRPGLEYLISGKSSYLPIKR